MIVMLFSCWQVFEDYDCMLNQTNIGNNNNKFYVIQVIKEGKMYYLWNRWGRVVSFNWVPTQLIYSNQLIHLFDFFFF